MDITNDEKIEVITHRKNFYSRLLEEARLSTDFIKDLNDDVKTEMHSARIRELEERVDFLQKELDKYDN